jgi:superfamily I DNA/RNA helicase
MSTIADRKADLLAFCVVYEALDDIAQVTTDPDELKRLDSVLSRGSDIIRRDFDDYKSMILDSFTEVAERYAQITKLKQVHQAVKPDTFILRSVILVRALLSRVRAVQDDFQREFTPKMQRVVRDIIRSVEQELPSDRLTCLASTPISSPWAQGFSWMRDAIRTVIPELTSSFEEAALEEAMAETIGTDIREANNVLKGDPSNTKAKRKRKSSLQEATDLVGVSDNPNTAKVISSAIKNTSGYVTKIGQKLNLNPDKESCVTLRGKGIIAAGAGSGKTLAMAAKVVYAIEELGFNPKEVIATSFTKTASKELQERIKKYGGDEMVKQGENTIGATTHSIATSILRKNGINVPFLSDAETNALIRTAIAQVGMSPTEDSMYLVERFDLYGRGIDRDPRKEDELLRKLSEFSQTNESWDESSNPKIQSYQKKLSSIILGIETGDLRLYTERMGRGTSTNALDPKYDKREWSWVFGPNGWLNKAKNFRLDLGDPSLASDPELIEKIDQFLIMKTMETFLNSGARRTASIDELEEGSGKPPARSISPQYATKPANKWFNLGWSKADSELSEKEVSMFIGKNKSSGISPETALDAAEEETIPLVAAYAAYEFLRNNDFGINPGALGFDDVLIKFVRTLVTDPVVRKNVQSQFKVVIVDEAQDLNDVQHKMFGLIAGALDPKTLEFREDGKMTADTYTMIGDDFQSIYAFRGSSPNTFVKNSDLKNGPFKTIMLTTNYRSARSIVEAGNAIIKHNKDQLPKVCDVPKDKEDGAIIAIQTDTFESSCEFIAEDIVKAVKMENASYDSFGIGTRTNAEVDSILLSLIERGIPFKSKRNPFDSKLYRSLTSWLKLSDAASLSKSEINGIVENAYEGGPFMLDMEFKSSLRSMAKNENFYDYLLSGRPVYQGRHAWRNATTVASYANALKAIVDLGAQNPTTLDLLNAIMELRGPKGKTFGEVILKSKQDDDDTVESEESKETIESVITPIYRLARNIEDASSCVRYLNDIMKTSKSLKIGEEPKPAVVVGTVHSWKGLECDSMYIMMQPNIFPHKRVDTEEGLQEERRLAYVAVTRGRNQVKILMPDKNMRNEDIFSNDPKTKAVMSPYASEACIPFTRV